MRQLEQLGHRLALGDPLRAEGNVDLPPQLGHHLLDQRRHPGEHRAAEHEELPVGEVIRAAAERLGDGGLLRVQVLVDRRADDHDHVLGRGHDGGIGRGHQAPGRQDPVQHLVRARLGEGQAPRIDRGDRGFAHVVDANLGSPVRERERERQADVPAPPDDDHISAYLIKQTGHRAIPPAYYDRPPGAPRGRRTWPPVTYLALYLTAPSTPLPALLSLRRHRPATAYGKLTARNRGQAWAAFRKDDAACLVRTTWRPVRGSRSLPRPRGQRTPARGTSQPGTPGAQRHPVRCSSGRTAPRRPPWSPGSWRSASRSPAGRPGRRARSAGSSWSACISPRLPSCRTACRWPRPTATTGSSSTGWRSTRSTSVTPRTASPWTGPTGSCGSAIPR